MAIFAKDDADKSEPRGAGAPGGDGSLSIIAHGMTVVGDINSNGVVKVEGRVEGSIRSARQVLIGRQGEVKGDVETREAVVGGRVEGRITALERVEVQGTAAVHGDIHTKTIVVLEGGRINGSVRMEDSVTPARKGDPERKGESRGRPSQPVAVVR
jgi:cytoskeletal protein CcmA (bactofilin family)